MPRILIVDDLAHVRAALVIGLRASGFDVLGVEDAVSGLRAFDASHFDLVITDVYMPAVDGVKLIKALRERVPGLPIIAMSGVMLNESEHTALEFLPSLPGLSEVVCLKKPFRAPELLEAIRVAFAAAAPAGA